MDNKKILKKYITLLINEGILKVPENLLKEVTEWVLNEFCHEYYENIILNKKKQIIRSKKTFDNLYPSGKYSSSEIDKIKEKIEKGINFEHILYLPTPEKTSYEEYTLTFNEKTKNLVLMWFSDGEESIWHIDEFDEFKNFLSEIVEESKNTIETQIKNIIDLISVVKPFIKSESSSEDAISVKKFRLGEREVRVMAFFSSYPSVFLDDEGGHFSPNGDGSVNLNLKHYLPDLQNFNITYDSSNIFLKGTIARIKDLVEHELKHFIQYKSKEAFKIGLPGNKQKTPKYSQHDKNGKVDYENHMLDDIEFQTNISKVILDMKNFLSKIDEDFRIPLFKLICGSEVRIPSENQKFTIEQKNAFNKLQKFFRTIFSYNSSEYKSSYAFRNLKVLREKAPLKYKKTVKEVFTILLNEMPMKNILSIFSFDEKIQYEIFKIY